MELVVQPKDGERKKFWTIKDFSYDQGYVNILGRTYDCDDLVNMQLRPEEIERIWIILDNEGMKDTFRKQLANVFWSSNDDGKALDIKVEERVTIVHTADLLDWAKVN